MNDVAAFAETRKQIVFGPARYVLTFGMLGPPPAPQHFQQARREHGTAILLAFALLHTNGHAFGIDVADG